MYDVLIVGCGIIGASMAYELSRYNLKTCVLESFNDVANGATKANNAILHAGYDSIPGTLEAKLILEGIRQAKELCEKLDVERRELPAMVVAMNEPQMNKVINLCKQGEKNEVSGVRLISREEILKREPNVTPHVIGGLIAPGAAIINPWEYAIALAETAVRNGVEIHLSTEVKAIKKQNEFFFVFSDNGVFQTRYVINAAGNFSDRIHEMAGGSGFKHTNYAGEYFVFDKSQCNLVNSLVFSCSVESGFKGTTIFPSVHGNLLAGPNFYQVEDANDLSTDGDRLEDLKKHILELVPSIDFNQTIRQFACVRPTTNIEDFIIEESPYCKNFINLAGMKSPGLSAAPAIAKLGIKILRKCGLLLLEKSKFIDRRKRINFRELNEYDKRELIKKNPLYGRVICRCETITEGEIVETIHRPITPRSIDAIKRRCNSGMGRCQGGFCGPKVHEILARELGVSPLDILMDKEGSYILTGSTKEVCR